ncbi:hypothetical protein QY76_04765 [Edwardsiella sp. EA181011]|nr:hypothetical protein QY76_04765 [Edwardsiella sp. EA181011]
MTANQILIFSAIAAVNHNLRHDAVAMLSALEYVIPNKKDLAQIECIILFGLNREDEARQRVSAYADDEISQSLLKICQSGSH